MIKVGEVVPYIGLNQKWSVANVEATGDHIVLNRKLFISFGGNFYCSDIVFLNPDIHRRIEYTMTAFLKIAFYWKKSHYWYLTITYRK